MLKRRVHQKFSNKNQELATYREEMSNSATVKYSVIEAVMMLRCNCGRSLCSHLSQETGRSRFRLAWPLDSFHPSRTLTTRSGLTVKDEDFVFVQKDYRQCFPLQVQPGPSYNSNALSTVYTIRLVY